MECIDFLSFDFDCLVNLVILFKCFFLSFLIVYMIVVVIFDNFLVNVFDVLLR